MPDKYLELSFVGDSVWKGHFGHDLKFRIDRLGPYFKVSKHQPQQAIPLPQARPMEPRIPTQRRAAPTDVRFIFSATSPSTTSRLLKHDSAAVSDVFLVKKLAVQFFSYDITVKELPDDLTVGKVVEAVCKDDLSTDAVTVAEQEDTQAPKPPALLPGHVTQANTKAPVSKVNHDSKAITPDAWLFAEITLPSASNITSNDRPLNSSLALAAIDRDPSNASTQLETGKLVPNILLYARVLKDKIKTESSRKVQVEDATLEIEFAQNQKLKLVVDFYFDETRTWYMPTAGGPALREPFKEMFDVELVQLDSQVGGHSLPLKRETKELEVEFHLEAAIYLFNQPFDLHLDIGPSKNEGFSISAVYKKPLDLEIVKLTGRKDPEMGKTEDGPANSVDPSQKTVNNNKTTTSASLAVTAGLSIFNCDPIPVNMGYESGTKSFFVSVALPFNFLGDTEAHSVTFRYKNGKLSFDGLKINDEFANKIKDFKGLMQIGSNRKNGKKPGCGELVGCAWKAAVQSRWKFGLKLPEEESSPNQSPPARTRTSWVATTRAC
ncbi:uncharacterized protein NECHADRAFT_88850 [Fusarium vanettenii 77-13-4]|uniref:Uncharacterized protein n=1 Tax=Fusarium vanettenii (strain ATCC MYA-4622 / CBS 123669 / FGSC 9596 / NRRL 45880 / 77-13-4) TaxID=660122 RepID=C7ZN35_FUSV7|nr:uncharacterized protein NECHADRAFT_88850 [Fusarium vanettenii 77-13-4]EEU34565.1 predicted protein [Fusarium vanettenii 77-13-4]